MGGALQNGMEGNSKEVNNVRVVNEPTGKGTYGQLAFASTTPLQGTAPPRGGLFDL